MDAARRAAVHVALATEPALKARAFDAAALDAACRLSVLVDNAAVSDTALAAASADPDDSIAAFARVLLHARATAGPVEDRSRPFQGGSVTGATVPSLDQAMAFAKQCGAAVIEVPRALLEAIGEESPGVRALRAAFEDDDLATIRALSRDFDVAELRLAGRMIGAKSLRAGLPIAGNAFRGVQGRERALEWSTRFERARGCSRKKRGALRAAVGVLAPDEARLAAAADAADDIWARVEAPPPFSARVALLCDAVRETRIDGCAIAPIGSTPAGELGLMAEFAGAECSAVDVDGFSRAVDRDLRAGGEPIVRVTARLDAAAADRLMRPRGDGGFTWPVADPPERVLAPSMTFSASRLNTHAQCARKFYYEYLCDAVEDTTTAHALYGKVFHAALESLHGEVRDPSTADRARVLDMLRRKLDDAFAAARREFASALEYEVLRARARSVAEHYVAWLFDEASAAPHEIAEVESRQILQLGSHRFVGYIDRIDRPAGGGPVTIYDYKTGRIEEDPKAYLREVRDGTEAQLALYYAMRRAQGDRVARVALVSIRDARDRTWVLALDIVDAAGTPVSARPAREGVRRAMVSVDDLERSLAQIEQRCDRLTREGVETFAVGEDPPCVYCPYAPACRARPLEEERIFAR